MSFKKLLGIISIVIVVMFALMLTTSYAWYSFEAGSTTFNAVTSNDPPVIAAVPQPNNTRTAVPINSHKYFFICVPPYKIYTKIIFLKNTYVKSLKKQKK